MEWLARRGYDRILGKREYSTSVVSKDTCKLLIYQEIKLIKYTFGRSFGDDFKSPPLTPRCGSRWGSVHQLGFYHPTRSCCVFFTWSTWPTMYSPPNPKICLVYALRPPPLLHFFFCSHALSQLISNGLTPTVTDRVIFGLLNHGARQCPWHSYHYFSSPFRLTLFLPTLPISFLHILNPHPLGSLPSAVFLHKVKRRVPDAGSD